MTSTPDNPNKEELVEGTAKGMERDMKSLVNARDFSDVSFLVGPEKVLFRGHKCILSARCSVFKSMCTEKDGNLAKDEPLVLADMNPDIFTIVLEFIYTNCCRINENNVMDVLAVALEYNLEQLVKLCEKYVSELVTIETACSAMQAAVTFGLDNLKRTLLPFFEQHTSEIFQTKGFNELSDVTLSYILQSDELNMDEYEILKSIKSWAQVQSAALDVPIAEVTAKVIPNVRLPLLSPEELGQLETDNAKDVFVPIEQISVAWKHLAMRTPSNSTLETTPRKGTRNRTRDPRP